MTSWRPKSKTYFQWAIGQYALTKMTKTVRVREPTSLPLYKLYNFSDYTTHRKEMYNTDFFDKYGSGESAADVWKRIKEVEKNS